MSRGLNRPKPPAQAQRPISLFLVFVVVLVVQLRWRRYTPFFHGTVTLSTSMANATMSDFMNRAVDAKFPSGGATSPGWGPQGLGLGHPTGAAILVSNTLGTSTGDFQPDSSGLGSAGGAALVTGVPLVLAAVDVPDRLLLPRPCTAFRATHSSGTRHGDDLRESRVNRISLYVCFGTGRRSRLIRAGTRA